MVNRIRELRKQKKMTQKELAAHLEIADSTLSYWEMGKYEPDHESLKRLSKFFNVSIDYILGGDLSEWETGRGRASYTDAAHPLRSDGIVVVGETQPEYALPGDPGNQSALHAAFRRSEFEGLTQEEISKLAEFARFLKTLRKK